jgi:D-inositol-3-phosphate glycosyltransferase
MTPLNIAMLSIHSSPLGELGKRNNGGMSVYIIELAAELERLGHRIDIFTLRRARNREQQIEMGKRTRLVHIDVGDVEHLSKTRMYDRLEGFFAGLEHFRRAGDLAYDLVHSHYWISGQVGQWAQAEWQVPHLLTFHSLGMIKKRVLNVPREPDLRIKVERHLAQTCDSIIVPTHRELENMTGYYETPRDKMTLIPCGVNLKRFAPRNRREAIRQLGLPMGKSILLYVGRFTSEKGIDRLLAAMPLIEAGMNPHLVMIGGDGDEDEATVRIKNLARRLGLADRVTFAGRIPQDRLPVFYSAADLMVLPSLYESFGLVALESLACGTPVVSTPVGALEHVILHGKTGEVVQEPGPEALARGMNRVLSRVRSGHISQEQVRASVKNFDWAHIAAAVSGEYLRLVETQQQGTRGTAARAASLSAAN